MDEPEMEYGLPLTPIDRMAAPIPGAPLQQRPPQAEARSYNPSWRDRIGQALAGENPSEMRRRMVSEAVGSTGIGNTGMSAIDLTPVGAGLSAQESAQAGDKPAAVGYGISAAAPFGGPAVRALVSFVKAMPRMAATAAGAGGFLASTSDTESGTLSKQQQRQLDFARQKQQAELEGNAAKAKQITDQKEAEAAQAMDLERRNTENKINIEQMEKDRQANMPFRERYPNLTASLPAIGATAAAALPYVSKIGNTIARNTTVKEMTGRVNRAETALPKATPAQAAQFETEMRAIKNTEIPERAPSKAMIAASALAPAEAGAVPLVYDSLILPQGNKDKEAAQNTLLNPIEMGKRIAGGMVTGVPAAAIGSKMPVPMTVRQAPTAQAEGLESAYKKLRRVLDSRRAATN